MRRIEYYTWSAVKYCITYNSHHIPHSWTYRDGHYALAVAIKWQWQVDTLVRHRPILRSRKSYFCQRLSLRKTIKMWFSISCVCKIIFRRRVMSYVIKVSLFFFVERERIYIINKTASSPVKKIWIDLLPCFNFGNLGSLWIESSCRDAQSRELSWSHSQRKLFDFSADPLYFLALMIVGVTKITALFTEIAYVKIDASGCDVLEKSWRSINNIVAVPLPLSS